MSAGLFTLFGMLVIGVPVALLRDLMRLWQSRAVNFRALSPIEQNVQWASNGAACIIWPIAAAYKLAGGVGVFLSVFAPGTRLVLMGVYAVLAAVGLARFGFGWRRSAGVRDGLLTLRAFIRLALGVFLLCWHLPHDPIAPSLYPWLALALSLVALWLLVTGGVRLAALIRPAGRALPEVESDIDDNEFDWNQ
jgi:hypothetical protein